MKDNYFLLSYNTHTPTALPISSELHKWNYSRLHITPQNLCIVGKIHFEEFAHLLHCISGCCYDHNLKLAIYRELLLQFVSRVNLPRVAHIHNMHQVLGISGAWIDVPGVNYDTLNWQFSNDHGNTLIREKDKQKQTHLYFHKSTMMESRETRKMDALFLPQSNYVPSALVCVVRVCCVFRGCWCRIIRFKLT